MKKEQGIVLLSNFVLQRGRLRCDDPIAEQYFVVAVINSGAAAAGKQLRSSTTTAACEKLHLMEVIAHGFR